MGVPAPKPSIDTCNACGKLFPRISLRLCTQCAIIDEHRFELVRSFLVENDGCAVADISRSTGVSSADVRKFMDGGRLVAITSGLEACSCNGVGQRCKFCRSKLTSSFRRMERTMQEDQAERASGRDPRSGSSGQRRLSEGDSAEGGRTSYVRRIRRIGDS